MKVFWHKLSKELNENFPAQKKLEEVKEEKNLFSGFLSREVGVYLLLLFAYNQFSVPPTSKPVLW
jgi:hypothetical protein